MFDAMMYWGYELVGVTILDKNQGWVTIACKYNSNLTVEEHKLFTYNQEILEEYNNTQKEIDELIYKRSNIMKGMKGYYVDITEATRLERNNKALNLFPKRKQVSLTGRVQPKVNILTEADLYY